MLSDVCPLCGSKCNIERAQNYTDYSFIKCEKKNCYPIKVHNSINNAEKKEVRKRYNLIYEFLLTHKAVELNGAPQYFHFFFDPDYAEDYTKPPVFINIADYINTYPNNISEKLDRILANLSIKYPNIGDEFFFYNMPISLMFIESGDASGEMPALVKYLTDLDYIETNKNIRFPVIVNGAEITRIEKLFVISAKGWQRISEFRQDNRKNKNVFVAMSFAERNLPVRKAIKQGIIDAGFSPSVMDEMIHNKQIVPEMFRLIKECRLLVMDITEPNYGAYMEAGYAMGLSKEIIVSCREEIYHKKDYKDALEEKAFKPHFDIAQKQVLVWKDPADLTKKLSEWIKYLFS